jgi:hypothetical protein
MANDDFLEEAEDTYTTWKNPLSVPQRVLLHQDGSAKPTRFVWQPGEEKQVRSIFDQAIQRTHEGAVIGGLAPQLVNVGKKAFLDPAFDTEAAAHKDAEAAQAAAALTQRAADQALVIAAAKTAELEAAAKAKAEADAAAKAAATPSAPPAGATPKGK